MRIKSTFGSKDKPLSIYTTDDLEILIATMDRQDLSFLEFIFSKPVNQITDQVLVVNQSKTHELSSDLHNIRVINDRDYGLSRSRNIALDNCLGPYVWILDDDVKILNQAKSHIITAINEHTQAAAFTFKMRLPNGKPKGSYSETTYEYTLGSLKNGPASIEMVLNSKLLRAKGIRFNERFGLGAQFQMGEEKVLFIDLLSSGERAVYIPEFVVEHPELSSGIDPAQKEAIYARGALAQYDKGVSTAFQQLKYTFFLWRKNYVKNWSRLMSLYRLFGKGADDYRRGS